MVLTNRISLKKDKILFFGVKILLLIALLHSLNAWFTWNIEPFVPVLTSIMLITFLLFNPNSTSVKKNHWTSLILFTLITLYTIRDMNVNAHINGFFVIVLVFLLISFKTGYKKEILNFITISVALMMLFSLLGWIGYLFGINLPHYRVEFNSGQYLFDNYFLFLRNLSPYEFSPRFSSVFLEPGQLGIMLLFLLIANRFNLRNWAVLIIFFSIIFTFSLASYLILFFSATIYFIMHSKRPFLFSVLWLFFIISLFLLLRFYNDGNNIFDQLIISRFNFDGGIYIQNNRFSLEMNAFFDKFLKSQDFITGIGTLEYERLNFGPNAGYKVFLVEHGAIGLVLIILFYISLVYKNGSKFTYLLLFVYGLSFLQAAYALWLYELLIFIVAMAGLNIEDKSNSQFI